MCRVPSVFLICLSYFSSRVTVINGVFHSTSSPRSLFPPLLSSLSAQPTPGRYNFFAEPIKIDQTSSFLCFIFFFLCTHSPLFPSRHAPPHRSHLSRSLSPSSVFVPSIFGRSFFFLLFFSHSLHSSSILARNARRTSNGVQTAATFLLEWTRPILFFTFFLLSKYSC